MTVHKRSKNDWLFFISFYKFKGLTPVGIIFLDFVIISLVNLCTSTNKKNIVEFQIDSCANRLYFI